MNHVDKYRKVLENAKDDIAEKLKSKNGVIDLTKLCHYVMLPETNIWVKVVEAALDYDELVFTVEGGERVNPCELNDDYVICTIADYLNGNY